MDIAQAVGLPEARIPLADAVVLVATSPKSNSAYEAVFDTLENLKDTISIETLDSISRSIGDYASAKADCAALYGIQVAITMNEIIKDPSIYSNYIMEKYISKRK